MTVAELIKLLEGAPQDAVVKLADWNEQYAPPLLLHKGDVWWSDKECVFGE